MPLFYLLRKEFPFFAAYLVTVTFPTRTVFGFAITDAPNGARLDSRLVYARWSLPRGAHPVVKLKYRGPNKSQPAASVTCKPLKSLRQRPEIIRKGTWRNVSDIGRNLGQVDVAHTNRHPT